MPETNEDELPQRDLHLVRRGFGLVVHRIARDQENAGQENEEVQVAGDK